MLFLDNHLDYPYYRDLDKAQLSFDKIQLTICSNMKDRTVARSASTPHCPSVFDLPIITKAIEKFIGLRKYASCLAKFPFLQEKFDTWQAKVHRCKACRDNFEQKKREITGFLMCIQSSVFAQKRQNLSKSAQMLLQDVQQLLSKCQNEVKPKKRDIKMKKKSQIDVEPIQIKSSSNEDEQIDEDEALQQEQDQYDPESDLEEISQEDFQRY